MDCVDSLILFRNLSSNPPVWHCIRNVFSLVEVLLSLCIVVAVFAALVYGMRKDVIYLVPDAHPKMIIV